MPLFDAIPEDDTTPTDPFGGEAPPKPEPDVPPERAKRGRRAKATANTPKVEKARKTLSTAKIEEKATELLAKLGMTGYAYSLHKTDHTLMYDSLVVAENADDLGKAIALMAERSPKFKRTVERLAAATEYSAMGSVVASVVIPIAWNHGLIPFKEGISQWISHPGRQNTPGTAEDRAAAEAFVQAMTGGANGDSEQQATEFVQGSNHAGSVDSLV